MPQMKHWNYDQMVDMVDQFTNGHPPIKFPSHTMHNIVLPNGGIQITLDVDLINNDTMAIDAKWGHSKMHWHMCAWDMQLWDIATMVIHAMNEPSLYGVIVHI